MSRSANPARNTAPDVGGAASARPVIAIVEKVRPAIRTRPGGRRDDTGCPSSLHCAAGKPCGPEVFRNPRLELLWKAPRGTSGWRMTTGGCPWVSVHKSKVTSVQNIVEPRAWYEGDFGRSHRGAQ